jgi:hypothetical protein
MTKDIIKAAVQVIKGVVVVWVWDADSLSILTWTWTLQMLIVRARTVPGKRRDTRGMGGMEGV